MKNWIAVIISLLVGLGFGIALCSFYFDQKVESRISKIKSDEIVKNSYQELLKTTAVGVTYSDYLSKDLESIFEVESDSSIIILSLKEESNTVDFYGFYMLLDSNSVITDIGLHKP